MFPKNYELFHTFYDEKRRVECKKYNNAFSQRQNFHTGLIGENNKWIKKFTEKKCVASNTLF